MFMAWATSHGADVSNISFTTAGSLRGAVAAASIPEGGVVGHLPEKLILAESTARSSPFGARICQYMDDNMEEVKRLSGGTDPYAPGLVLLAAFLAYERFVSPSSFWFPYLTTLPKYFSLPLEWPEDDVDCLLRGTNLMHIVRERRRLLNDAVGLIQRACEGVDGLKAVGSGLAYKELLWGYAVIASRAFPKQRGAEADADAVVATEAVSELCLYPVLDMLNHRRATKIEWNSLAGGMTFISLAPIEPGATLWNNYGPKGNENLLSNYGFVLTPNLEDYFKLALNVRREDPLYEMRMHAMVALREMWSLKTVHLLFGDDEGPTKAFVNAARILVASRIELEAFEKGAESDRFKRCDVAVWTTIWNLLRQKLAGIEPWDTAGVGSTSEREQRERMAGIYRNGQISILSHYVTLSASQLLLTLESISPQPPDNPSDDPISLFHMSVITIANPLQNERIGNALATIDDPEGLLDEEAILCLLLIAEAFKVGTASAWAEFLSQCRNYYTADRVVEIMGNEADDVVSHFTQSVRPLLRGSFFSRDVFKAENFLWASCILDRYVVSCSMEMLGLVNSDGGDEAEAFADGQVYGVVAAFAEI
ncbi:hypothetical protein HK101_010944 [Irineochytrium annulatum]|nr:hypothetical protein HK101_010944 [Irineochytrium annulatum]